MIVEYIRYTVPDAQANDFIAAYQNASVPLMNSPYCLSYELSRCEEEPTSFIVRIEWTSTKDHLEQFRGSTDFREFFKPVKSYVEQIDEMHHYSVLSAAAKAEH